MEFTNSTLATLGPLWLIMFAQCWERRISAHFGRLPITGTPETTTTRRHFSLQRQEIFLSPFPQPPRAHKIPTSRCRPLGVLLTSPESDATASADHGIRTSISPSPKHSGFPR